MATPQPSHKRLIVFMVGMVWAQGFSLNLLPVMFGTLAGSFGLGLREQGQLNSCFFLGAIMALLASGYVTEWIGPKKSGSISLTLVGTGILLVGLAPVYSVLLLAATLIGLGNQWILSVHSSIITTVFPGSRQKMFMWVMAVLAMGAMLGPYLLGFLLTQVKSWRSIFLVMGPCFWVWLCFFLALARGSLALLAQTRRGRLQTGEGQLATAPATTTTRRQTLREALAAGRDYITSGLLNRGTLWMIGFLVFLDSFSVSGIMAWTPRYFELNYGANTARAGLLLSASAVGVLCGRFLMGTFVTGKLADRVLLGCTYALGMVMYAVILLEPSYPIAVLFMGLNGACLAAQAPSVYSLTSSKFPERAAIAIPLVDAIGSVGGLLGPTFLGFIADRTGNLGSVLWLVPICGLLLAAISLAWESYDRRRS